MFIVGTGLVKSSLPAWRVREGGQQDRKELERGGTWSLVTDSEERIAGLPAFPQVNVPEERC